MMSDTEPDADAGAGAGANASSKADMTNFMRSDTLAELVWSPQTGLNIKFAEKKPCSMLQDGPSESNPNEPHIASLATPNNIERKRKCSLEQELDFESKRIKKQAELSFTNWISNMSKGVKRVDVSNETGFQNVFETLFSPETVTGSAVLNNKQVRLYEGVSKEVPKGMFDTIRRLRLSRNDIHKWMNSQLPVTQLDGFFLRLRVAKREEEAEGSRYYVACITGLQWETPWKDLKQPIRVKVGGVECFVESQHISNCDFIEDELVAWWQKTSENQRIEVVKDLKSKLAVRRTLGM